MIDFTTETVMGVADVSLLLRVHRRTVEKWFERGLEHVKLGGRVFTSKEALNRFAEQSRPLSESPRRRRNSEESELEAMDRELEEAGLLPGRSQRRGPDAEKD